MNEDTEGTGSGECPFPYPSASVAPSQGGTPHPSKAAAQRQCHGLGDCPRVHGRHVLGSRDGCAWRACPGVWRQRCTQRVHLGSWPSVWSVYSEVPPGVMEIIHHGFALGGQERCREALLQATPPDISALNLWGEMPRCDGRNTWSLIRFMLGTHPGIHLGARASHSSPRLPGDPRLWPLGSQVVLAWPIIYLHPQ